MIYLSIIISFLILLCLVITGVQNNAPLQIQLLWWTLQMSLPAVVFWAATGGAVIVAVLGFPKLGRKTLQTRRLNKEVRRLEGLCGEPSPEKTA